MELLPLLLILGVMILPLMWMSSRQRKAQQKQKERVDALGVGDEVRTHSGFYGLIVDEFDDIVILESENGAQTKWARQAISMKVDQPGEDEETAEDDSTDTDAVEDDTATEGDDSIPGVTVQDSDDERRDR